MNDVNGRGSGNGEGLAVLMVDSESTWRGGEAQLRLLMRGLSELGCAVSLAAPPQSEIRRRSADLAVEFYPLGIAGGVDLVSAWRLRSLLRSRRFDVVHAHSSHAHAVMSIACAALGERPRTVVSRRVDFAVAKNPLGALKYRRGADLYLAISTGVRDALRAGGIGDERIRLVPSGIDLDKFGRVRDPSYLREEFGVAPGTVVVGNVAALAPHKAQSDLLRAAAIVCRERDDVRFFIVGEGALRKRLEALARVLGVEERVTFTGFREDVLELLSMFDCFVMSSYLEGLGTSIMDAQAMRVPVVATDTGGIPDVVEDRVTGLLVPPRDPESLARAVLVMISDNDLKKQCVTEAYRRSRGYDYRSMVYKTLDAYRALCAAPPL